jgi:hypothetical protein
LDFLNDIEIQSANPEQIAQARALIEGDEVGFTIVEAGETLPSPSLEGLNLNEDDKEVLQTFVDSTLKYLKRDIISDTFGSDSEARRRYRSKFKQAHSELTAAFEQVFENNKLRWRNSIAPLMTAVSMLQAFGISDQLPAPAQDAFSSFDSVFTKYGFATQEDYEKPEVNDTQRIKFAQELADQVKKILQALDTRDPHGS